MQLLRARVGVGAAVVLCLESVDGEAELLFRREVIVRLGDSLRRVKRQGRGSALLLHV